VLDKADWSVIEQFVMAVWLSRKARRDLKRTGLYQPGQKGAETVSAPLALLDRMMKQVPALADQLGRCSRRADRERRRRPTWSPGLGAAAPRRRGGRGPMIAATVTYRGRFGARAVADCREVRRIGTPTASMAVESRPASR
jgi:hypothetical protein